MTRSATVGLSTAAGALPGAILAGTVGAVVGGLIGLAIGVVSARFDVRLVVSVSVVLGTVAGAFIGRNVVRVLCRPGTCTGWEVGAATTVGIIAFVVVGIVVALATRSFDEYRETRSSGRPPPVSSGDVEGPTC